MIQDIFPKIYHNEYKDVKPTEHDFILVFHKNTVLVRFQDEKLRYPTRKEMTDFSCDYYYLFSIDDYKYFLARPDNCVSNGFRTSSSAGNMQSKGSYTDSRNAGVPKDQPIIHLPGYQYENITIFRTADSRHTAFAGITGHHLFHWYETNHFCGRCGNQMQPDHKERMLKCPCCENMVYPRISPAVIVGVTHKGKLLMSKYAGRAYTRYALIAGFTEIGESAEETVKREVMEEVGLKVKNIRYYKSQPWAFSGSLLMGFFAELDGDDTITLDTNELAEAGWFTPKEIDLEDDHLSLTREMILLFKNGGIASLSPDILS